MESIESKGSLFCSLRTSGQRPPARGNVGLVSQDCKQKHKYRSAQSSYDFTDLTLSIYAQSWPAPGAAHFSWEGRVLCRKGAETPPQIYNWFTQQIIV